MSETVIQSQYVRLDILRVAIEIINLNRKGKEDMGISVRDVIEISSPIEAYVFGTKPCLVVDIATARDEAESAKDE